MAKTKNVVVRKKNKADKPMDFRREPTLWETKACCQRGPIVTF